MSAADVCSLTVSSASETATAALAAALAHQCRAGDCILLRGDLGAGKTAFARGFIQAIIPDAGEVTSPTFTLLQTYPAAGTPVLWHFDLYRLESPDELAEIGLDEALQSYVTLVEWPEIARGFLPDSALDIAISMGKSVNQRDFTFTGLAPLWNTRLMTLEGL